MMRFTPPAPTGSSDERGDDPTDPTHHAGTGPTYVWERPGPGVLGRLGGAALTLTAALGVLCLVGAGMGVAMGITPLVVRSGSMDPAIPVGALVLAKPVPTGELSPGEVVSVSTGDGSRVTHRVAGLEHRAGSLHRLTLQGDANAAPDAEPVIASHVDRVIVSVPRVGGALHHLGSAPLNFVAGLATGTALLWAFGPRTVRSIGRWVAVPTGRPGTRGVLS